MMEHQFEGDRLVVYMDPGQPIELTDLTDSFAALARIYERHYRKNGEEAPRLYVTKLETGSIWAEIAPLAQIAAQTMTVMDYSVIVSDFSGRISRAIRSFAGKGELPASVSRDDAKDLAAFVRPMTGKAGASLGLKHAKFERSNGSDTIKAEYTFDDSEINRATVNIDKALETAPKPDDEHPQRIREEVALIVRRAGDGPGKERGRTDDRGLIKDIHPKALPVYFKKRAQGLKNEMMKGDRNPLTHTFIVDVSVQYDDDKPVGYIVTDVHDAWQRDDGAE